MVKKSNTIHEKKILPSVFILDEITNWPTTALINRHFDFANSSDATPTFSALPLAEIVRSSSLDVRKSHVTHLISKEKHPQMDLGLRGKIAMVAASSKGLGFGVAQALAAEGARLSLCSRTVHEVEAAAAQLTDAFSVETMAVACDVRQPDAIHTWVEHTVERWGKVDALLVNAGGPPTGPLLSFDDAQWQTAFELTLMSTVRMIRAVVPHMSNGGAILTITSSSVREPIEQLGLSTVMRSGVAGLVKTLADELAPQSIRVNNLIPGRIQTERVTQIEQAEATRTGKLIDDVRAGYIARIPLQRMGTIEEFGAAAAFLLSPAASYITGASLRVDGGLMRSI